MWAPNMVVARCCLVDAGVDPTVVVVDEVHQPYGNCGLGRRLPKVLNRNSFVNRLLLGLGNGSCYA